MWGHHHHHQLPPFRNSDQSLLHWATCHIAGNFPPSALSPLRYVPSSVTTAVMWSLLIFRIFAKKRYTWSLWSQKQVHSKTKYKSHARSPAIGQSHRTCFWLEKARYIWFCLLCLAFKCFIEFWANQWPYISALTRIIRRLIVMDWHTATRTRSLPILHEYIRTGCSCLLKCYGQWQINLKLISISVLFVC